jgi:hypothetical protein
MLVKQNYNNYNLDIIKMFLIDIENFMENIMITKILSVEIKETDSTSLVMVNKNASGSFTMGIYRVVDYFTLDILGNGTLYYATFEDLETFMLSEDFYNLLNWGKEWWK